MVIKQISQIINNANEMAFGKDVLAPVDASNLLSTGNYIINSASQASRDIWVKAIVDQCADIQAMDRPLAVESLGLERDEREYGSVRVRYRIKPIDVENNEEYAIENGTSSDPYVVKTPEVTAQMYGDAATYEGGVTILNNQLKQAFQNESQMVAFFSYIMKTLSDAFVRSENSWDRLALANFIAEKFAAQTAQTGKQHAINLLPLFNKAYGKNKSVDELDYDPDFNRFFVSKMIEWKKNLTQIETDLFNTSDGYTSQVPLEYLKVFVNAAIAEKLPIALYSDTYHREFVTLDGYREVPFWQAITKDGSTALDFDSRTSIDIKLASDGLTEVKASGILAVLMDKDAVATTYKREEAQSWMIPKKGTQYWRAETAQYINDLLCNAVILYVADVAEVSTNLNSTEKGIVETAFAIDVDESQNVISTSNSEIEAVLNYVETATTFDMTKGHHFITFKLTSDEGQTIKVKCQPTQGMGWVTLDDDGLVVMQVTANTKGFFVDVDGTTAYVKLNLTLNPQEAG